MRAALVLLGALAASQPAFAQDAPTDDWNLVQRPEQKLTMAATVFDTGVGIAVRCLDGDFEVLLAGLPPAEGPTRRLRVGMSGGELTDESWTADDDQTVWFSDFPMGFARRMRDGGTLNVIVPGENDQPNRRYVLNLPTSTAAIDAALTACGRPLVDLRSSPVAWVADDGTVPDLQWRRLSFGSYPDRAMERRVGGRVVLTCSVLPRGRVGDCVVESERPGGYGFGREAQRAAERGTIIVPADPAEAAALIGRRFSVAMVYRMTQ